MKEIYLFSVLQNYPYVKTEEIRLEICGRNNLTQYIIPIHINVVNIFYYMLLYYNKFILYSKYKRIFVFEIFHFPCHIKDIEL